MTGMYFVNFQMNRILILVLIASLSIPLFSLAQSREMGLVVGAMNYKGDLNDQMYSERNNLPAIGMFYRRSYSNHWAFKSGLSYGHIAADDAEAEDAYSKNRNLNFRSPILELTGQIEFNFFPYQTANPSSNKATPFLLFGVNVFRFNPKGLYDGDYVALQPLGTEGQGTEQFPNKKRYSRTSAAIVFGGGMKFRIGRRFGCTIETAVRRTYTDYLDDVSTVYADPKAIRKEYGKVAEELSDPSFEQADGGNIGRQRGDTAQRDWFVFTGIQISYTLSKYYIDSCRPFRIKLW
jgi:hypothetical protein